MRAVSVQGLEDAAYEVSQHEQIVKLGNAIARLLEAAEAPVTVASLEGDGQRFDAHTRYVTCLKLWSALADDVLDYHDAAHPQPAHPSLGF